MGRLVYDLMWNGFNAVGCEFSLQMMFAANFFMNWLADMGKRGWVAGILYNEYSFVITSYNAMLYA